MEIPCKFKREAWKSLVNLKGESFPFKFTEESRVPASTFWQPRRRAVVRRRSFDLLWVWNVCACQVDPWTRVRAPVSNFRAIFGGKKGAKLSKKSGYRVKIAMWLEDRVILREVTAAGPWPCHLLRLAYHVLAAAAVAAQPLE